MQIIAKAMMNPAWNSWPGDMEVASLDMAGEMTIELGPILPPDDREAR